jgi:hypothetical protein
MLLLAAPSFCGAFLPRPGKCVELSIKERKVDEAKEAHEARTSVPWLGFLVS